MTDIDTRLKRGVSLGAGVLIVTAATPAAAYVGPGAGLSLLGALWGVLFAVFAALAFVVIWPIRRLIKRRSGRAYRMAAQTPAAPAPEERAPQS